MTLDNIRAKWAATDKVELSKNVFKFVVRASVGYVITNAVANYIPSETITQKVRVAVGAYVLSSMVKKQTDSWSDETFSTAMEFINQVANGNTERSDYPRTTAY